MPRTDVAHHRIFLSRPWDSRPVSGLAWPHAKAPPVQTSPPETIPPSRTTPSSRPGPVSSAVARKWPRLRNPRFRIALESILLVLALTFAVVWFYTPYVVRDYINRGLAGLPDYDGRVESVRIHPITASIDIYDLHVDKRGGDIPVPFFHSPRWNVSLQWSQIFHGVFRASVLIYNPRVNLVNGPSSGQSQVGISGVCWVDAIKQLIPWRVNQLRIYQGDLHFLDFHADPQVDLECADLNLDAENMSNSRRLKVPLPATVKVTARPLVTGEFEMTLAVNLDERYATFKQDFRMEHVPAVGANSALQQYLKVRAKSGEIGLYSELAGDKGVYHGYAKPFFYNLEFEPKPSDQGNLGAVWSGVLNIVKGIFEDDRRVIATETPISGRVDDPKVDTWDAIGGALWNAWIESIKTGFDRDKTPPTPNDTVTTPQTGQTREEAQQKSPARQGQRTQTSASQGAATPRPTLNKTPS